MLALLCSAVLAQPSASPPDFARDVLPILADHCFPCHGPDARHRKADLRLDRRDAALAAGVIVPGDADASELVRRIFAVDSRERMPPARAKLDLADPQREVLRRWVAAGADFRSHWAFAPLPESVAVPAVFDPGDPIDAFVAAGLQRAGQPTAAAAAPERWLRRVHYDLVGLPPEPAALAGFVADPSPAARAAVVDRLLASPRFGETFAVAWLDAARYADSYGYQSDQLCTTWPYRDWVVRAFNGNLPYDRFLVWQLAGDLLPGASRDQRLATAFNRLHRTTNEGGSIEQEFRVEYVADRVATFGTAMLGLTLECARCHDHKFDPVSQREYYALFAYFQSIDEWGMYNDSARVPTPALLLPTPDQEAALAELEAKAAAAAAARDRIAEGAEARFRAWCTAAPAAAAEPIVLPGLCGDYRFDARDADGRIANQVAEGEPAHTPPANVLAPGRTGQALRFTGDHPLDCRGVLGSLPLDAPFTVSLWLWLPADLDDAIVFHRTGGTDVGYHGIELGLRGGRLRLSIQRFWPGNALAVESALAVARERWVHIAASWDASFAARGLRILVDGVERSVVLRDNLTKLPQHGGSGLTFGERFRDRGLRSALLDDLRIYDRALAPIEVRHLGGGPDLRRAVDDADPAGLREWFRHAFDAELHAAERRLAAARAAVFALRTGFTEVSVMEEMAVPRPAYVLARGAYDAPRTADRRVEPGVPACLPPLPPAAAANRLGLARWLTDPDHPLTARVAVNRLWAHFFGRGLVPTADNFGRQGAPPTHPDLLDHLARSFIASGWDVKAMCRRIVLTTTYGRDSAVVPAVRESDPDNTLLGRGPAHRLPAEMLRDAALFAAGLLDERRGGPPVSPYQPGDLWRESNTMSPAYRQSVGADLYRRSLYTVWKRTAPMPDMSAFDVPTREVCVVSRARTSTPLQALVLLNDVAFVEAARTLAERSLREAGLPALAIDLAFVRAAARPPTPAEREVLAALFADQRDRYTGARDAARALLGQGDRARDDSLGVAEAAALTVVCQAILNSDAVVWKR